MRTGTSVRRGRVRSHRPFPCQKLRIKEPWCWYTVDFGDFPDIIGICLTLSHAFVDACEALDFSLESSQKIGMIVLPHLNIALCSSSRAHFVRCRICLDISGMFVSAFDLVSLDKLRNRKV